MALLPESRTEDDQSAGNTTTAQFAPQDRLPGPPPPPPGAAPAETESRGAKARVDGAAGTKSLSYDLYGKPETPGTVAPVGPKHEGVTDDNCAPRAVKHQYTEAELAFRPDLSRERPEWRPAHEAQKGKPLEVDGKGIYIVQVGDTLSDIASRELMREGKANGTADVDAKVRELVAINRDAYPGMERNAHLIRPGWELRVTGCNPGDTSQIVIPPIVERPPAQPAQERPAAPPPPPAETPRPVAPPPPPAETPRPVAPPPPPPPAETPRPVAPPPPVQDVPPLPPPAPQGAYYPPQEIQPLPPPPPQVAWQPPVYEHPWLVRPVVPAASFQLAIGGRNGAFFFGLNNGLGGVPFWGTPDYGWNGVPVISSPDYDWGSRPYWGNDWRTQPRYLPNSGFNNGWSGRQTTSINNITNIDSHNVTTTTTTINNTDQHRVVTYSPNTTINQTISGNGRGQVFAPTVVGNRGAVDMHNSFVAPGPVMGGRGNMAMHPMAMPRPTTVNMRPMIVQQSGGGHRHNG